MRKSLVFDREGGFLIFENKAKVLMRSADSFCRNHVLLPLQTDLVSETR